MFFLKNLVYLVISFHRKKENLWVWKNVVDLKEPKPDVRTAFRVVIDNNWQGIAYLMLEVAGLDFIEAIQVMSHETFMWMFVVVVIRFLFVYLLCHIAITIFCNTVYDNVITLFKSFLACLCIIFSNE